MASHERSCLRVSSRGMSRWPFIPSCLLLSPRGLAGTLPTCHLGCSSPAAQRERVPWPGVSVSALLLDLGQSDLISLLLRLLLKAKGSAAGLGKFLPSPSFPRCFQGEKHCSGNRGRWGGQGEGTAYLHSVVGSLGPGLEAVSPRH